MGTSKSYLAKLASLLASQCRAIHITGKCLEAVPHVHCFVSCCLSAKVYQSKILAVHLFHTIKLIFTMRMNVKSVWLCGLTFMYMLDTLLFISDPQLRQSQSLHPPYTVYFPTGVNNLVLLMRETDWEEKQSCLKSHLGWEAAHMESYQIVLILLIGCSTLNRSSC